MKLVTLIGKCLALDKGMLPIAVALPWGKIQVNSTVTEINQFTQQINTKAGILSRPISYSITRALNLLVRE